MADSDTEQRWYKHKGTQGRIGYAVIFLLGVIFAWFLRDYGEQLLGHITLWRDDCPNDKCFGKQGVLRISMSLFLFFIGMSISMIGHKKHEEGSFRTKLQDGFWIVKVLVLIALVVVAYLLPNVVMVWYGYIAIFGAAFFVFLQVLLLVDFAYDWNDSWVEKERFKPIIGAAIVIYIAALVGIVLEFVFFGNKNSCGLNIFLIIFNTFLCGAASVISVNNNVQRGALLTSAVVTGFCTFSLFSALLIQNTCNPFPPGASTRSWLIGIGAVIAIASICWNTFSSATKRGVFSMTSSEGEDASLLAHEGECYNFSYFHLVFATGAMYMAMLFTGWNLSSTLIQGQYDIGPLSFWMKICSSWVAVLLYIWSMLAPTLFPDRDWS